MSNPLSVLLLEDNPSDAELILHELRRAGYDPQYERVYDEAGFLAGLEKQPELILADYRLPQYNGLHALQKLQACQLDIPFILISGTIGEDLAVEALKLGAHRLPAQRPAGVEVRRRRRLWSSNACATRSGWQMRRCAEAKSISAAYSIINHRFRPHDFRRREPCWRIQRWCACWALALSRN